MFDNFFKVILIESNKFLFFSESILRIAVNQTKQITVTIDFEIVKLILRALIEKPNML